MFQAAEVFTEREARRQSREARRQSNRPGRPRLQDHALREMFTTTNILFPDVNSTEPSAKCMS